MKELDDVRTIQDVSEYINECLACDGDSRYHRYEIAGWIVGLAKLDNEDAWYESYPAYARIHDLAVDAEVSEENADSRWQWLCGTAEWLSEVVASDK